MFTEYRCGCIISIKQGRVRMCVAHRPAVATGDGGVENMALPRGIVREYPANG